MCVCRGQYLATFLLEILGGRISAGSEGSGGGGSGSAMICFLVDLLVGCSDLRLRLFIIGVVGSGSWFG